MGDWDHKGGLPKGPEFYSTFNGSYDNLSYEFVNNGYESQQYENAADSRSSYDYNCYNEPFIASTYQNPSHNYVGFNQFLSQFQNQNWVPPSNSRVISVSHMENDTVTASMNTSHAQENISNKQIDINLANGASSSNLTPTALEFFPKQKNYESTYYSQSNPLLENERGEMSLMKQSDVNFEDVHDDSKYKGNKKEYRFDENVDKKVAKNRSEHKEYDKRNGREKYYSNSTDWRRSDEPRKYERYNKKEYENRSSDRYEKLDRNDRTERNGRSNPSEKAERIGDRQNGRNDYYQSDRFGNGRNKRNNYDLKNSQLKRNSRSDYENKEEQNDHERRGGDRNEEKISYRESDREDYKRDYREDFYDRNFKDDRQYRRDPQTEDNRRNRNSYRNDYERDDREIRKDRVVKNERYQRRGNDREDFSSKREDYFKRDQEVNDSDRKRGKDQKKDFVEVKQTIKFNARQEFPEAVEAEAPGSQRERLTLALDRGTLECLVCCERVKPQQSVWACAGCHHVLHLACTIKWAATSKVEQGWRCPACQRLNSTIPRDYYCFCGKLRDPPWNRQDSAHSCGELCGRGGPAPCPHNCTLLCHPGPCPPCQAQVNRKCGCGRTKRTVQCSQNDPLVCDEICSKLLNCGVHQCSQQCHEGLCNDCDIQIEQVCFCGKSTRQVKCTLDTAHITKYECGSPCDALLTCGSHKCTLPCHELPCPPCELDPATVKTCPCGKKSLPIDSRKSCLCPVPLCDEICAKPLKCGPPSQPHTCQTKCHSGTCPVCPLETLVRCRCGHMDREIPCSQLTSRADDARCQKKCTKKRECGRHKCNAFCCIAVEHPCPLPCSHTLSCGLHKCEQNCHRGRCQPCWRSSFDELYCECGASVLYPPVPCGTRKPQCDKPCTRTHSCNHPVMHTCHSDTECPPCTVLSTKWCHGKHEMRKTIPCHQVDFSCGKPCGKPLPCGRHSCQLPCHTGECLREGQICTQACTVLRTTCEHPCKAPCHEGNCPDTPCKEMVKVTCECGHRSTSRACADTAKDFQRIITARLASKMADMQRGQTVDIQDIMSNRPSSLKTLECTEECRIIERNRRLTVGLQIRNPDLSAKLSPRYSEFLKQWAKRDPTFVQNIHEKLTELVQLAKQSKQKTRSYSFQRMNREKRQVVHEMCEQFGCEGKAYDAEPNRNVVATADREKSWLPSLSLMEVVQRECGQRKVPVPSMGLARAPPKPPKI